jgi:hypothetical protein
MLRHKGASFCVHLAPVTIYGDYFFPHSGDNVSLLILV